MSHTTKHFSLSLPQGEGQDNIPDLLRHLAKTIEDEQTINIRDIVFHNEIDSEGNEWPHFTIYYN